MSATLEPVFTRLREVLLTHAADLSVTHDSTEKYGLEAPIGAATLRAWKGKVRAPRIPVAWIEVRKAYVSFHLMGLQGNPKLVAGMSPELRRRMQGKSCFNFKELDDALVGELGRVTAAALSGMRQEGYISDAPGPEGAG